jgi:ribosomal protein S15
MFGKCLRAFITTSQKAQKLATEARKRRAESRFYGKPDELVSTPHTPEQISSFNSRPIPKSYRHFIDDVLHMANPAVRAAYNIANGTPREIRWARKQELAKRFGKNEKDFGHPAVQVGAMTEDIYQLAVHVKNNNLDTLAFLNLKFKLERRRKMLQYLLRYDFHAYEEICEYLGISKLNYGNHKEVKNILLRGS